MRVLLTRDVPTMVIIPTLKTIESHLMNIIQPYLSLTPPETAKIMMKIMMIRFTLVPLTTCFRKDNLSSKSPTSACKQPCQKPENKSRSANTTKNARTMEFAYISTATNQNLISKR